MAQQHRDYWGKGYAHESAAAVLSYASKLSLTRIVAITAFSNAASRKVLLKLGFSLERQVRLPPDPQELLLYAKAL